MDRHTATTSTGVLHPRLRRGGSLPRAGQGTLGTPASDARRRQRVLAVLLCAAAASGCATSRALAPEGVTSLGSVTAIRTPTPEVKGSGLGKALALGVAGTLMAGGLGAAALPLAVGDGAVDSEEPLDFGAAVLSELVRGLEHQYLGWPETEIDWRVTEASSVVDRAVLEVRVTHLFIGWLGLVHGGNGLMASSIGTLRDREGEVLWRESFIYYSGDFDRGHSIDEYKARDGKLLREELKFAAAKTAEHFLRSTGVRP